MEEKKYHLTKLAAKCQWIWNKKYSRTKGKYNNDDDTCKDVV